MSRACQILIGLLVLPLACKSPVPFDQQATVDGVPFEIQVWVHSPADGELLFSEARGRIEDFSEMTRVDGDSALAAINAGARQGFHKVADDDLYRCLLLAHDWARASHGSYDPTLGPLLDAYRFAVERGRIPGTAEIESRLPLVGWGRVTIAHEAHAIRFDGPEVYLDLAGIRRGFALDLAARSLANSGVYAGLLRFDSTTYAWLAPPGREDWDVAILDPADRGRTLLTVSISHRAISVSGAPQDRTAIDDSYLFERMDGRSGLPASNRILAAVALADSAAEADVLADAFYVGGYRQAAALLERSRRVEGILYIRADEGPTLLVSSSLKGRVKLAPALADAVGDRVRYILPPQSIALMPDVQ